MDHVPGFRRPTEAFAGGAFECYNLESETIPAFSVVRAVGFEQPEIGRLALQVRQSNAYGSQYGHYVTGPGDISANGYGLCTQQPAVCTVDTNDSAPQPGESWGPVSGSYKLRKRSGGFRILGNLNSNVGLALVMPAPLLFVRCVLDEELTAGSSATGSVLDADGDTGHSIEVYDQLEMEAGQTMATGAGILAAWFEDWARWVAIAADECATDA